MSENPPSRGTVAGRGLAVMAGWYLTIVAAFALWVSTLPAVKTDGSCDGIGYGCTPNARDGALLVAMFFGLPALAVSALISAVALAIAAALRVPSGLLAGNIAAFAGIGAVGVAIPILASR